MDVFHFIGEKSYIKYNGSNLENQIFKSKIFTLDSLLLNKDI